MKRRDVFAALADPTRRALLLRVTERPRSVNALAEGFAMTRPAVSKHLRVLAESGLVELRPGPDDARRRIAHARLDALAELDAYLERLRAFGERGLDRLGDLLDELGDEGRAHRRGETSRAGPKRS